MNAEEWFKIAQTGEPNNQGLYWIWSRGWQMPIIAEFKLYYGRNCFIILSSHTPVKPHYYMPLQLPSNPT